MGMKFTPGRRNRAIRCLSAPHEHKTRVGVNPRQVQDMDMGDQENMYPQDEEMRPDGRRTTSDNRHGVIRADETQVATPKNIPVRKTEADVERAAKERFR